MSRLVIVLGMCTLLLCCTKTVTDKRTFDYFSANLKTDMDYPAIVNQFGAPDADNGSGIHIYVYKLSDSTEIWIGYTDHIHYARHLDSNHLLLHTII